MTNIWKYDFDSEKYQEFLNSGSAGFAQAFEMVRKENPDTALEIFNKAYERGLDVSTTMDIIMENDGKKELIAQEIEGY